MIKLRGKQAWYNRKIFAGIIPPSVLIVAIISVLLLSSSTVAQELPYPNPLLPKANATGIPTTSIPFSWTPFGTGTSEYTFELSKNIDMSNPIIQATVSGGITTYAYMGTLEYNTTYYWRVTVSKPLGPEGPVSIFTTKAAAASTNNATAPPKDSTKKSFPDSLIAEVEKLGWPLVGGIAGVILIIVIALLALAKPKAPPTGQGQWRGAQPPPRTPQPLICPACGSPNTPDRRFCNNCGANLMSRGTQQTWGPPPQQGTLCPTCGFPNNPPGQKFCGNCGTTLFISGQQPPRGAPQTNVCPSCSTPNPPGQKFCNRCGAGLAGGAQQQTYQVYQTFSCPICGAPINKGTNPCPSCRTWLDWGTY